MAGAAACGLLSGVGDLRTEDDAASSAVPGHEDTGIGVDATDELHAQHRDAAADARADGCLPEKTSCADGMCCAPAICRGTGACGLCSPPQGPCMANIDCCDGGACTAAQTCCSPLGSACPDAGGPGCCGALGCGLQLKCEVCKSNGQDCLSAQCCTGNCVNQICQ